MDKTMHIDVRTDAKDGRKTEAKAPLFKYEPDSKYTGKLWLLAAIAVSACAVLYVIGLVLPSATLTGIAMFALVISIIAVFLLSRKMKRAGSVLTSKEIDEAVENYKVDLINTFNGYDLDYEAKDVLSAADDYRKLLEADNAEHELGDDESIGSIFKKMLDDSGASRKRRKEERKADKLRRKEDRDYVKSIKRREKGK